MTEKYPLDRAELRANQLAAMIRPMCKEIEIVGSIRRGKEMVHDIDIVIIPNLFPSMIITRLMRDCEIEKQGNKIIAGNYMGIPFDIYLANKDTFETLKLIRTGSKEHNIKLCKRAKEKGWKLKADGTGLVDEIGNIIDNTERGILNKLLGGYIDPEGR